MPLAKVEFERVYLVSLDVKLSIMCHRLIDLAYFCFMRYFVYSLKATSCKLMIIVLARSRCPDFYRSSRRHNFVLPACKLQHVLIIVNLSIIQYIYLRSLRSITTNYKQKLEK
jgi:hypothetical protein